MNKIALRFEQAFWPQEQQVIAYASERRGRYPLFLNLHHYTGEPALVCLVPPSFENGLENLTEADAKAGVLEVLRRILAVRSANRFRFCRRVGNLILGRWVRTVSTSSAPNRLIAMRLQHRLTDAFSLPARPRTERCFPRFTVRTCPVVAAEEIAQGLS